LEICAFGDPNYAKWSTLGHGEGYGVAKHHDESCVAFNEGAFHKAVFDKVGEVLVDVKAHVYRCKDYISSIFDSGGFDGDIFVYGDARVFARKAIYADYTSILVFAVSGPGYGAGGAFAGDLDDVARAYVQFLHGFLVYAGYTATYVSLFCVSYSELCFAHVLVHFLFILSVNFVIAKRVCVTYKG